MRRSSSLGMKMGKPFTLSQQFLWAWRVSRFLSKHGKKYELVHLQGVYLTNILAVALFVRTGRVALLPVLEDGDLRMTGTRPVRALKRALYGFAVRSSKVGFALSPGIKRELDSFGVPSSIQIGNVVDTSTFRRLREFGDDSNLTLGFVGKLGVIKRPHLVLETLAELHGRGLHARAVFVGPFENDDYERFFYQRAKELTLEDHVRVVGFTSEVSDFVNREMDLFVLASSSEGLPGALAEAMASGIPAIVTDVGGMASIVRAADCGVIVSGDAVSISDAIEKVVRLPNELSRLSENGRRYALENFSDRIVAMRYMQNATSQTNTATQLRTPTRDCSKP